MTTNDPGPVDLLDAALVELLAAELGTTEGRMSLFIRAGTGM